MKLTALIIALIFRSLFYFSVLYILGMFIIPIMFSGRYVMGTFSIVLFPLVYFIGPFLMGGYNVMILVGSLLSLAISFALRSWVISKYGSLESD